MELRRKIGYVIQQIGLFPHMTIQQNISLVPKLLKWPEQKRKERARELLKLVDMGGIFRPLSSRAERGTAAENRRAARPGSGTASYSHG